MEFNHKPIMADECMDLLNIKKDGIYVDGTVGGAGHASGILSRLGKGGRLIAIDRDSEAIAVAQDRLAKVETQGEFTVVKGKYSETAELLKQLKLGKVNGILLDIGVSSYQLDRAERGFGYMTDSKLDMRMGADEPVMSAYDIVNEADVTELEAIIRDYGEERWWKRIAQFIVAQRQKAKIETTQELVNVITAAIPAKARREKQHPAKRTFQGLRIAVNKELDELSTLLDQLDEILLPGGRAAVITFHSLEDRIVKTKFKEFQQPCTCPPGFPKCVCGKTPTGRIITNKPVVPSEDEIEANPRARSAKLRVLEWI
ncbi:MAG TPA: 16S rRNA (cytosine(1402)-N(4))-methyltransferase [Clostridiales bacterium]|nr:16S rRNA (cytosine(1402)-N(4))-methyltransferase [Clostridiales bacterium]